MIGLDTNILVRYFTQDDEAQARIANEIMESRISQDNPGFISSIVLVEMVWTLARCYKVSDETLFPILETLLTSNELSFEYREESWRALQLCQKEKVDFADALIGMIHHSHGCNLTLTFDKRAAETLNFKRAD